jgi:dTDP-glucose 4,6-dehydratase/UDP-glucose 4-epimerase
MVSGAAYEVVPFPVERKAIDIGDYFADFSRIRDELGWSPVVMLADGLARTIDYYRANGHHYGLGSVGRS